MTTEHTPLVVALRALRARTGLSLAALAERTEYSKSSWERYLNGKSLPPRGAVEALCRVTDEPAGRLLALWEIAESDWSGRASVLAPAAGETRPRPQEPTPPAAEQPRDRGGRRIRLVLLLATAYVLLAGGVALVFFLSADRDAADDASRPAPVPYSLVPTCHGAACEGRDPLVMICGIGPDTLTTYRTATGAHVELRYSEKCGAGWARTWGTRIGDRVEVAADGPTHEVRVRTRDDTESYVYTGMTEAGPGSSVRACFRPASADDGRECVEVRVGGAATTPRQSSPGRVRPSPR
jgi:transcriptional regulator with XRE-family HTH domain